MEVDFKLLAFLIDHFTDTKLHSHVANEVQVSSLYDLYTSKISDMETVLKRNGGKKMANPELSHKVERSSNAPSVVC